MAKGRPRSFDLNDALDKAINVFWENGYENTSLDDLTAAMGINRPSLYAAFGNKESLFRKALDRYCEKGAAELRECLASTSARKAIRELLDWTAEEQSCGDHPSGCLMMQSMCGDESNPIKRELSARRHLLQDALRERLQQARKDGELPGKTDTASLARYYATVMQGMIVQASGGAGAAELKHIAKLAMRAWPEA